MTSCFARKRMDMEVQMTGSLAQVFYAHIRNVDDAASGQLLSAHLLGVAELARKFSAKIGLASAGKLMGLLHDMGKYSDQFQKYLLSAEGLIDQDRDDFVDARAYKGKIDHSSAGAQYLWCRLKQYGKPGWLYGRLLALGMASHHSGLINSLAIDGDDSFIKRMSKDSDKTHLTECHQRLDAAVSESVESLFSASPSVVEDLHAWHKCLLEKCSGNIAAFRYGLLARFLLSCLRDADCIDSACFENPELKTIYCKEQPINWSTLINKLEGDLSSRKNQGTLPLNTRRRKIADDCLARASDGRGLFTLTVPTGGGKTLSSLRFALHHARQNKLERIFYIIPYTSIIDQNAKVVRDILEADEDSGSIVLEHHSNILPEDEKWQGKHFSQNWDAPIVFTTMVQFLEALFAPGTSKVRRMHNLANSVIIFDEIQTLPPRLAHLFCNSLNFLVEECGSSAVLCTATQPLLGKLPTPQFGQLTLGKEREIMPNPAEFFEELRRVEFINHCDQPMDLEEIGKLALDEVEKSASCLVVANTKKWASDLYNFCQGKGVQNIFYLSTALCPAHRLNILNEIIELLKNGKPVLCLSTQLIECGVDISFGAAIRFAAGLDSILQTAGRCNRNMEQEKLGRVHIVRPPDEQENLQKLPDIAKGKSVFQRILREYFDSNDSEKDLNDPDLIERYFEYYFYARACEMRYPVSAKKQGRDDTLWNLLGKNELNPGQHKAPELLRQSFKTAAECFQPIDSPGRGIIVPYGKGKKIIAELCSASGQYQARKLLRQVQRYTVNVYPYDLEQLQKCGALYSIAHLEGLLFLRDGVYGKNLGLNVNSQGAFTPVFA